MRIVTLLPASETRVRSAEAVVTLVVVRMMMMMLLLLLHMSTATGLRVTCVKVITNHVATTTLYSTTKLWMVVLLLGVLKVLTAGLELLSRSRKLKVLTVSR